MGERGIIRMAGKFFSAFFTYGFPMVIRLRGNVTVSGAGGSAASMPPLTEGKPHTLTPLNQCWFGVGPDGVRAYWSRLGTGRPAEGHLPALDLLFPFLYGIALAGSLWWIWMTLGRPFHPAWIVAPLLIITMADWLESLMLLAQLRHYMSPNQQYAGSLCVRLSSCATIIRLWLAGGFYVSLAGLVLKMLLTFPSRRLASDAAE